MVMSSDRSGDEAFSPPSDWDSNQSLRELLLAQQQATMTTPPPRLDCHTLLDAVVNAEAVYQTTVPDSTDVFGHPAPPQLAMLGFDNQEKTPFLMVAWTPHVVMAQVLPWLHDDAAATSSSTTDPEQKEQTITVPLEVTTLAAPDEESEVGDAITCLTVVALEDQDLLSSDYEESSDGDENAAGDGDDDDGSSSSSEHHVLLDQTSPPRTNNMRRTNSAGGSSPISPQSTSSRPKRHHHHHRRVLLRGAVAESRQVWLAIVLGTQRGHVYTVEMLVDKESWTMQRVLDTAMREVLPADDATTAEMIARHAKLESFQQPAKQYVAVSSLSAHQVMVKAGIVTEEVVHVFVTYNDAHIVRLHHTAVFPSVWPKRKSKGGDHHEHSLDTKLGLNVACRWRVQLPAINLGHLTIQPLPVSHASPVPRSLFVAEHTHTTPAKAKKDSSVESSSNDDMEDDESSSSSSTDDDSVTHRVETFQAVVYGDADAADLFPTICFYTSEGRQDEPATGNSLRMSDLVSPENNAVLGAVVGGTKALVGGMFGALGFGRRSDQQQRSEVDELRAAVLNNSFEHLLPASSPFPSLWRKPISLFAGYEIYDAPRLVQSSAIDPRGATLAVSDSLGRVLLIDLESKQIVRLWKGYRDASVYWIETKVAPGEQLSKRPIVCLAIHSRHRRIVEVWRANFGNRLLSIPVDRDAQVVQCARGASVSFRTNCFLVHTMAVSAAANPVEALDRYASGSSSSGHNNALLTPKASIVPAAVPAVQETPSTRAAALRLQHFQQLITASTVEFSVEDLKTSLHAITSLVDLATCLDLVATATALEAKFGKSAAFQKITLMHCKNTMQEAAANKKERRTNPNVQLLDRKIEYHRKIVEAFEALEVFDPATSKRVAKSLSYNPSSWESEAVGWASTYEQVMKEKIAGHNAEQALSYTVFASSCVYPADMESKMRIYFTESSRTRRDVLVHVFKPLLGDVFGAGTTKKVFELLGVQDDSAYVLRCFGEWFMTLAASDIRDRGLFYDRPPMSQLLKDLAVRQLKWDEDSEKGSPLEALLAFCGQSTDLVRAFMLGTVCREAISGASAVKERTSYGKVSRRNKVEKWDALLRKIRVCLLVSVRLRLERLGNAPLSVANIESDEGFSPYEWLARDELAMSQSHDEILFLEQACSMSSFAFDPSTEEGDAPSRCQILRSSCFASSITEEERAEYLVDFEDDGSGSLLLFFRSYIQPPFLMAHRALIWADEWAQSPGRIDLLQWSCVALEQLSSEDKFQSMAYAVRLEVWQSKICPIYRIYLFNFDEMQTFEAGAVTDLLEDRMWFESFGRTAAKILGLLEKMECRSDIEALQVVPYFRPNSWPRIKKDYIFDHLIKKARTIDADALNAHMTVVCALTVSGNVEFLSTCLPLFDCFGMLSLFNPMTTREGPDVAEVRTKFVEDAIGERAMQDFRAPIENFECLAEITKLCRIWELDVKKANTDFLLAMYKLGKDNIVDELVGLQANADLLARDFVEEGVDIVCRRLNGTLTNKRMRTGEFRNIMALLDPDVCEWIKTKAKKSLDTIECVESGVTAADTHQFTLRLLNASILANVDSLLRVKIHSLAVLAGTLAKKLPGAG